MVARAAGAEARRGAGRRERDAAAGERAALADAAPAGAGRRPAAARGRDPRHARAASPAAPDDAARARRLSPPGRGSAIVLLNRRGWSNFLSCGACGRVWMCPNCEVALVLHRAGATVACHHCGHSEPIPTRCPDCGSVSVARHGAGTERLESELVAALGGDGFPVFRLDADAGRRRPRRHRARALLRRPRRAAGRHPDDRQGPRLRRRRARGRDRRRPDTAVSRLPRGGADVRARHAARRAGRAGRKRWRGWWSRCPPLGRAGSSSRRRRPTPARSCSRRSTTATRSCGASCGAAVFSAIRPSAP